MAFKVTKKSKALSTVVVEEFPDGSYQITWSNKFGDTLGEKAENADELQVAFKALRTSEVPDIVEIFTEIEQEFEDYLLVQEFKNYLDIRLPNRYPYGYLT